MKAHHILGNLCFAAFGGLAFSISNVAHGWPVNRPFILLMAILITGGITGKDFHDYEGDKAQGDITFPVKVGKKGAAAISIGIMVTFVILTALLFPGSRTSLSVFVQTFWNILFIMGSFGVYMALDCFGDRLSNAYSGVQYYFVIFLVAYWFLGGPLGLSEITWLATWDKAIILSLYTTVSSATVYIAWKKGRVLKPA